MSALSAVPRLLRTLLQLMQVKDLKEAELPQLGQILSMLLQHAPLHSHLMASSALLQDIIQQLTVTTHQTLPQLSQAWHVLICGRAVCVSEILQRCEQATVVNRLAVLLQRHCSSQLLQSPGKLGPSGHVLITLMCSSGHPQPFGRSTTERFLSDVIKCIKYFPLKRCGDLLPTDVSVVIMMLH